MTVTRLLVAAESVFLVAAAHDGLAATPPMGFNTWNKFGCKGISAQVLKDTADQFVELGLHDLGYEYINSDDCWMMADRANDGNGPQIENPDKFPDGMRSVADYIHARGLKLGLYTAKAPHTCAGFAASCEHEEVDVTQWANWTVDYMKDDSCGTCRDVIEDYTIMQKAIKDSGRDILLTIEGGPDITQVYTGCCGQARRVGHDINPSWIAMVSLIDYGSGLWPYAHNGSLGTSGGFWNDLDMLELGNGEFTAETSELYAAQARSHYSLWAVMKAVMLLGNDLTQVGNETLSIIKNKEVIAINQDSWGRQARRVAVQLPKNTSLLAPHHAIATMSRCSAEKPLQRWHFHNSTTQSLDQLFIAACNASDPAQHFGNISRESVLRSTLTGACLDQAAPHDQHYAKFANCSGVDSQHALLEENGHLHLKSERYCLDCYGNKGPNVFVSVCKQPGEMDTNQRFAPLPVAGDGSIIMLKSAVDGGQCLTVQPPKLGGLLYTRDDTNNQAWCLQVPHGPQSEFTAEPCDPEAQRYTPKSVADSWTLSPSTTSASSFLVLNGKLGNDGKPLQMGYESSFGSSGPVPHSRWVRHGRNDFLFDLADPEGSPIQSTDISHIIDDDNVGNVTSGGAFCLELSSGSSLEIWAGMLSGHRWAVALFNRSPESDTIHFKFDQLPELELVGISASSTFTVRDIWADKDHSHVKDSFSAIVPAHDTALLIVSPEEASVYV